MGLLVFVAGPILGIGGEGMFGLVGGGLVSQVAMISVMYVWFKYLLPQPERKPRVVFWMGVAGPIIPATVLGTIEVNSSGEGHAVAFVLLSIYAVLTVGVSGMMAYAVEANPDEFS